MTDMKDDDTKLDASNPQELLEYIQRLKSENARLESRSRLGLNFEDTPDENVVRYSTRVPLSAHEPENDVMTDDNGITHDLIIGDNYPGLLTLLPKYEGKINVIYIDPPYNTGNNDFIYNDRYTNPEDSYKHSKWLSFMEPRLKMAARLLSDDGIIFISIDDHEQARLKLLMDGIFGERNFVNDFIWVNNLKGRQLSNGGAVKTYEHILLYRNMNIRNFVIPTDMALKSMPIIYRNKDYEVHNDEYGDYVLKNELYNSNSKFNEDTCPSLVFNIYYNGEDVRFTDASDDDDIPGYTLIRPHHNNDGFHKYHAWRWSKEKIANGIHDLEFIHHDNTYRIYTKIRKFDTTSFKDIIMGISTGNIDSIMGKHMFDFPKPVQLLKTLLRTSSGGDSIILDFFAGSGTTGQAVAELNAADGGHRHCILITDEGKNVDDPSAVNIARDITHTRLQRVLTGRDWADGKEHPSLNQNLRTHHLTSVSTMKQDGVNKRATDDIIMDIIDDLYHEDHGGSTPVEYTAYLDKDYQSRARAILNSWRNAVRE